MKTGLIVVNGQKHFRSGPKCQCCSSAMIGADPKEKACNCCVGAGCKEGYARYWTRGEECPRRAKARKSAGTANRPVKNKELDV